MLKEKREDVLGIHARTLSEEVGGWVTSIFIIGMERPVLKLLALK